MNQDRKLSPPPTEAPRERRRDESRRTFVAPKLERHEKLPEVTGFSF